MELVDTLGLEPGAFWCEGSSPSLGKLNKKRLEIWKEILIIVRYVKRMPWQVLSEVAQLVEQVTVNHWVVGSSPSLGVCNVLNVLDKLNGYN